MAGVQAERAGRVRVQLEVVEAEVAERFQLAVVVDVPRRDELLGEDVLEVPAERFAVELLPELLAVGQVADRVAVLVFVLELIGRGLVIFFVTKFNRRRGKFFLKNHFFYYRQNLPANI